MSDHPMPVDPPPQVAEFNEDNCYFYLVAFNWVSQMGADRMSGYAGVTFYTPKALDNSAAFAEVTKMCQDSVKLSDQNGPVIGAKPSIAILNIVKLKEPKPAAIA